MILRDGEVVVRSDYVTDVVRGTGLWRQWHPVFHMFVTSQRLVFAPPEEGGFLRTWSRVVLSGAKYTPHWARFELQLTNIKKIWTWSPQFSAPPALELWKPWQSVWKFAYWNSIPDNMIGFSLMKGRYPELLRATHDEMEAHCETIKRAVSSVGKPEHA